MHLKLLKKVQIQIAPKLIKENEPFPANQEIFHLMQRVGSDVLS